MDQAPSVSGVKPKNNKTDREGIRAALLSEKERETQDRGRKRGMTPENYTIGSQRVTFVGASHIFNAPENESSELKRQLTHSLTEFSKATEGKKAVYIVEGEIPKDEDLQSKENEKNITIKAAHESGSEYISGDPSPAALFEMMQESQEFLALKEISIEGLGNFNKEDLTLLYFFFRDCNLENETDTKNMKTVFNIINEFNQFSFFDVSDLKQILESYPKSLSKEELLQQAVPLFKNIISKLQAVSNYFEQKYPDTEIKDVIEDYDSSLDIENEPNLREGVHAIATIVRRERDVYLLEQIQKQTSEGNNLMVVYGASHQTRTRPALEAMSQNG
jgi:hypothetical protein